MRTLALVVSLPLSALVAYALALTQPIAGQGDMTATSIAKFNLSVIFENSPQMKRLQEEIEAMFGPRTKSLRREQQDLEKSLNNVMTDRKLSPTDRNRNKNQILARLKEIQSESVKVNGAADARKLEFLKRFEPKLSSILDTICRQRKIDLVLPTSDINLSQVESASAFATILTRRTVWHTSDRIFDLTDAVMAALRESQ